VIPEEKGLLLEHFSKTIAYQLEHAFNQLPDNEGVKLAKLITDYGIGYATKYKSDVRINECFEFINQIFNDFKPL
jgi:hypothetical protein